MNNVSISVVTYSALDHAKKCIASVLANTPDARLILTANGSVEAGEYFEELREDHGNIRVIHNSTNEGFIAPNRFAFGLCDTPYFVLLNDDARVPVGWLEKMVVLFDSDPKLAIVGQRNACCSLRDNFYGYRGDAYEYAEFSCAMVRTSIMRELGLFSDYVTFANCEDSDASLRVREAGYHIACADFHIQHVGGATRRRGVPGLAEIFHKNLAACQARWGDYLKSKDRKFPCEK